MFLALVSDRLQWCFRDLPFVVALAQLRLLANALPTPRRMQSEISHCLYGCVAIRGDDISHYMRCPFLVRFIRGPRHQKPVWLLSGDVAIGLGVFPTARAQVLCSCTWTYVAYRICFACRARSSAPSAGQFWHLARAVAGLLLCVLRTYGSTCFWLRSAF